MHFGLQIRPELNVYCTHFTCEMLIWNLRLKLWLNTGEIHVRKTNKMHLYLINLFQLNYPIHVSNKRVRHQ
jgi:hypothetical protein